MQKKQQLHGNWLWRILPLERFDLLSPKDIAMLPAGNDYSQAAKGAYIVTGSDENRM